MIKYEQWIPMVSIRLALLFLLRWIYCRRSLRLKEFSHLYVRASSTWVIGHPCLVQIQNHCLSNDVMYYDIVCKRNLNLGKQCWLNITRGILYANCKQDLQCTHNMVCFKLLFWFEACWQQASNQISNLKQVVVLVCVTLSTSERGSFGSGSGQVSSGRSSRKLSTCILYI